MSDEPQQKGYRIPYYYRRGDAPPANYGDGTGVQGVVSQIDGNARTVRVREVRARAQCGSMQAHQALETTGWDVERAVESLTPSTKPSPRVFTWDDAREVANLVRDGLLMIVKGIERKFDLGKKDG